MILSNVQTLLSKYDDIRSLDKIQGIHDVPEKDLHRCNIFNFMILD